MGVASPPSPEPHVHLLRLPVVTARRFVFVLGNVGLVQLEAEELGANSESSQANRTQGGVALLAVGFVSQNTFFWELANETSTPM